MHAILHYGTHWLDVFFLDKYADKTNDKLFSWNEIFQNDKPFVSKIVLLITAYKCLVWNK